MKPETRIYLQLSQYIHAQYPGVIFHFDMKLQSIGAGMLNKRMNPFNGFPDLIIFFRKGDYSGLAIEIKKDGEKIYKKNGEYKSDHIKQQSECLTRLRENGFSAHFGIGFYECQNLIDKHLK